MLTSPLRSPRVTAITPTYICVQLFMVCNIPHLTRFLQQLPEVGKGSVTTLLTEAGEGKGLFEAQDEALAELRLEP